MVTDCPHCVAAKGRGKPDVGACRPGCCFTTALPGRQGPSAVGDSREGPGLTPETGGSGRRSEPPATALKAAWGLRQRRHGGRSRGTCCQLDHKDAHLGPARGCRQLRAWALSWSSLETGRGLFSTQEEGWGIGGPEGQLSSKSCFPTLWAPGRTTFPRVLCNRCGQVTGSLQQNVEKQRVPLSGYTETSHEPSSRVLFSPPGGERQSHRGSHMLPIGPYPSLEPLPCVGQR